MEGGKILENNVWLKRTSYKEATYDIGGIL